MEWCLINVMAIRTIELLLLFELVQNCICIQDIMNYLSLKHGYFYSVCDTTRK